MNTDEWIGETYSAKHFDRMDMCTGWFKAILKNGFVEHIQKNEFLAWVEANRLMDCFLSNVFLE